MENIFTRRLNEYLEMLTTLAELEERRNQEEIPVRVFRERAGLTCYDYEYMTRYLAIYGYVIRYDEVKPHAIRITDKGRAAIAAAEGIPRWRKDKVLR